METTIVYWGNIGIMEKKMETTLERGKQPAVTLPVKQPGRTWSALWYQLGPVRRTIVDVVGDRAAGCFQPLSGQSGPQAHAIIAVRHDGAVGSVSDACNCGQGFQEPGPCHRRASLFSLDLFVGFAHLV